MSLLLVIGSVALATITLSETQQANTYGRTLSIAQAQSIAETMTRAIRNAYSPISSASTPIIEASPYELYFYQQSYSNPGTGQLAVIWLAPSVTASPPSSFETAAPSCPCSVEEAIYSSSSSTSYGNLSGTHETKTLGTGITPPEANASGTTTTSLAGTIACSKSTFSVGGSGTITTIPTSTSGIFQFYDDCLSTTTNLSNVQTIGVTLQAQYSSSTPLVTVTSYVQIRNLSSGS